MTESGIPAEIFLSPGAYSDTNYLYDFSFPVPSGSAVYGDKAYNACNIEDDLEQSGIHLNPVGKKNSKRKYESFTGDGVRFIRKSIGSAFSVIRKRFPTHIHAVISNSLIEDFFFLSGLMALKKNNAMRLSQNKLE